MNREEEIQQIEKEIKKLKERKKKLQKLVCFGCDKKIQKGYERVDGKKKKVSLNDASEYVRCSDCYDDWEEVSYGNNISRTFGTDYGTL